MAVITTVKRFPDQIDCLCFTKSEQKILEQAASICRKANALLSEQVPQDIWDDTTEDLDIALCHAALGLEAILEKRYLSEPGARVKA